MEYSEFGSTSNFWTTFFSESVYRIVCFRVDEHWTRPVTRTLNIIHYFSHRSFAEELYFSGERTREAGLSPIPINRLRLMVCVSSLNVYPSNSPLILIVPVGRICFKWNVPCALVWQQGFPSMEIWTLDNGLSSFYKEKYETRWEKQAHIDKPLWLI